MDKQFGFGHEWKDKIWPPQKMRHCKKPVSLIPCSVIVYPESRMFAQELKTPYPVSPKKINRLIKEIEETI
jgi:hypothetical protein